MLYYLFGYLDRHFDFFGAGVFKYISFRAVGAIVLSLLITVVFGKNIIGFLQKKQIGETIRELGLDGQAQKKGTPTMGGLIIIAGILIPVLLLARIDNIYIILLCLATVWLGLIGFLDDYIKVFRKNKSGLNGRFKIIGQIGLGLAVGIILFSHRDVRIREYYVGSPATQSASASKPISETYRDHKSLKTTIPFVKNNEMDYDKIFSFLGEDYVWIGYSILVILVITAVSNGANITDGIDGLAAGTSAIIALTLGILAYVSGNTVFAQYLNIMYIPDSGEIVVFCAAFLGACIGFLWYNSYPAQVFMGDTGSLAIGGIIAVLALCIRKEWLIPVLCGIFLVENLSVLLQVAYFKYTRIRFGQGKRIFLMAPLHHHYQKKSFHESKIVIRFWIIGILLAAITLSTLKLR